MKQLEFHEVQKRALNVLKRLTEICDEQNLKYVLAWGTLIGAVRHKGFIPWDDDIDIMMPRHDYNRLLAYFSEHKEELLPYEALTMETRKNYPHMICRISDSRTWLDVTNEKNCDMGVFVDIYPMDGLGNSYEEAMEIMKKTTPNCSLIFLAARKYYHFGNTKGWKKRLIKIPAFIYTHIMGQKYFVNKVKAIVKNLDYDKSSYIGCAAWATNPKIEIMKKDWFKERVKVQFEDNEFYIPKDYDIVLRTTYGDYMQLPPEKDRIHHHLYKAYLK